MKLILQRVKKASVYLVEEKNYYAKIKNGILCFVGFCKEDKEKNLDFNKISKKILNLRIFEDSNQKMNINLIDIKGYILIVSQFTLCADPYQGNRPSFTNSLEMDLANQLYEKFILELTEEYKKYYLEKYKEPLFKDAVQYGKFRSNMQVYLINDGPVTIILDY